MAIHSIIVAADFGDAAVRTSNYGEKLVRCVAILFVPEINQGASL